MATTTKSKKQTKKSAHKKIAKVKNNLFFSKRNSRHKSKKTKKTNTKFNKKIKCTKK